MSRLTLYILKQMILPFLITAFTLTVLITLPQAIGMLSVVVVNGQSLATYLEISSYFLIAALPLALPLALFIAIAYALHALDARNEITAMFSLGFNRRDILRPALCLGCAVAILTIAAAFYPRAWSNQMRRVKIHQVHADIASTMLRAGTFTNPARGVTTFIRDHDVEGRIHGILFQDARDWNRPITYIAETGALVRSQTGARLVMFNGVVQQHDRDRPNGLTTLSFDKYSYNLSSLIGDADIANRKTRELYPQALFFPDEGVSEKDRALRVATGHRYLALLLHCLIFTILAVDVIAPAHGSRHRVFGRMCLMSAAVGAIEILSVILAKEARKDLDMIPFLYLTPLMIYALNRLYMILNPFRLRSFSAGSFHPSSS